MADESVDHEKTSVPPMASGIPSPRRNRDGGNVSNDSSNGCAVSSTEGVKSGLTETPPVSIISSESTTVSRTSTTTVGVTTIVSATTTVATTMVPLSTWTSTSETGAAPVTTTTPGGTGGGGVIGSTTYGGSGAKNNGNISPRSPKFPRKTRVRLSELQLESATREEWAAKWREQDLYVECLEAQIAAQEGELACLRDSEEKYRQQCFEISHRERILMRRLASKEQQLLAYANQITEMRGSQAPTNAALRSALLDPAVNILVQKLRQELLSTKAKLEDTQNELSAWKFTPDSNTGKRLMAKCRLLYQENEELGRMIASGRIAKLEGELLLQKSFSEEVKKSQSELDEFLQDLDEDVEGMQSTIYFLQQELRKARESVSLLQQENNSYKAMSSSVTTQSALPSQPPKESSSPQPAPPTIDNNNGLLNGIASHTTVVLKAERDIPSDNENEFDRRSSEDAKLVDPVKKENTVDNNEDDCTKDGAKPAPSLISSTTAASSSLLSSAETKSVSRELDRGRNRLDEQDESSNDSAALIIKVENEELSDRDDSEDVATVATAAAATSESRPSAPQRQARTNIRESTMIKSENTLGNKSNGDDRSSRPSSRRLLRDRTAKRDKSAAESDEEQRGPSHKKKRRESILSLDYTETDDDALLFTNGENMQSDPEDGP